MLEHEKYLDEMSASLVANGSYARLEASEVSYFDYFLLIPQEVGETEGKKIRKKVKKRLSDMGINDPSDGGAFGAIERSGTFAQAIGGNDDDNRSITRRILFLTEGRSIVGEGLFDSERDATLKKYVRGTISDHQLGLFLLKHGRLVFGNFVPEGLLIEAVFERLAAVFPRC